MKCYGQRKFRIDLILLRLFLGLTVALFGFLSPAYPDEDIVEYQQLKAEVIPVEQLFQQVKREFEGIILELELEEEDLRWIYEVKLLTPQGNVLKINYDAKSIALLTVKGQRDHSP